MDKKADFIIIAAFIGTAMAFLDGCSATAPAPFETVDIGPVLVIELGPQEDLTILDGTEGAEHLRFTVRNVSDRPVQSRELLASFYGEYGWPLVESDRRVLSGIFVHSPRTGSALMGPLELPSETAFSGTLRFGGPFVIYPGESLTLVLRADVTSTREGGVRFDVELGESFGALLTDVVYFDTGEPVPASRIENNHSMVRHVRVVDVEEMTEVDGSTALLVQFQSEQGILHPSEEWWFLGTIFLSAYGGDAIFRGVDVYGANIGWVSELTLTVPGSFAGAITFPSGACSCGTVRLTSPVTVPESGHAVYEVWGRITVIPEYPGELTLSLNSLGVDAEAADRGEFAPIVSTPTESRFRVWETHPVITALPLASTTIANGGNQGLFKFLVDSVVADEPLYVGSLTVRFAGGSGGTLSDLRVRVDSAELSPSLYRVLRTSTGEEIPPTAPISTFSEQVTFVFTEIPGLPISELGREITIMGTPQDFEPGERLDILFGDRVFSYSLRGVVGNMTPEGLITVHPGTAATDPIIWTTGRTGGVYTGAWEIGDLAQVQTLTRR